MSSFPYVPPASIFNTLDYRIVEDSGISLAQADARYFRITGGYVPYINSSSYLLDGVSLDFTLLTDITAGTAQANKLIAVDSNRDITNFRNISLSGTLIASNDISSPIINSNQYLLSGSSILTSALTGIITGTASASKALVLDSSSNIVGINSLSATNLNISGTLSLPSLTSIINSQIIDTNNASISYPLTIQHLLSSGSPTNNSFGVGLKFQMPNSINNTVDYGAIDAVIQQNSSGLQQGQLNFYTTFAGSLVNAMTLSSLTSPTNNILVLNGATSLFSAYRLVCDNILCNSNISISKASLPNLTITSTATNTLSQLLLVTDNQTWEIGARGSTNSSNPTNLYIYNGQLNMVMSPAGVTQFLNTAVSTTSTSNSLQISGGVYTAKAILNNSYYNSNTINSGATSHTTSLQAICLNDQAIYFRSQNANDTNHGIMYSKNANWNAGNGFGNSSTYKTDGPVIFGNEGVMIGNLNSASTETICATFKGTTTSLLGTVNINTPPATPSRVNIQSFGTQLGLINNANGYAYLSSDSQGGFTITTNNPTATPTYQTYLQYYFDSTWPSGTAGQNTKPRLSLSGYSCPNTTGDNFRLYLGNTPADIHICWFNQNNLSPSAGVGYSTTTNANQYCSPGVNGHKFYYSSASGVGAPLNLGTNIFSIQGNGNIVSLKNTFANAGVHAFGYDTTDLSSYGDGVHLHYAGGHGSVFAYNYSAGTYKDIGFNNNNLYIRSSNGYVGIGTTLPTCPLHVVGAGNQTTAATFGWLSGSGTGIASGFTNRAFSIRCSGGIMCDSGEIDVLSDELWKENILDLNDDLVNKFIKKINPIQFNYKNSDNLHYGYSAQNILLNNFNVIVAFASTDEPLDQRELSNKEGNKIIIPKDTRLIVNPIDIIPILHKALQLANDRIKRNEEAIAELRELIKPAQEPAKLKRVVKKLNRVVYSSK